MFEGKKKRGFIQNNRDPYKEEIKIPPPYPHRSVFSPREEKTKFQFSLFLEEVL
jgi:hypothetical protein